MEHFKIVNVCCFYIQIPINISTNVLTFYFLGFQKGTLFLELKLNHCSLLLFVSCCTRSSCIFWEIMGFLKNYVANMGQIAKKLRKSSTYGAALKLCSLLVTLLLDHDLKFSSFRHFFHFNLFMKLACLCHITL